MKLIYVASPYAGDVEKNVAYARRVCREIAEHGYAFVAPHLMYPEILDDAVPEERQAVIKMGLTLLQRCDELWAFGPVVSSGMQTEIAEAERLRIPIRRMDMAGELVPPDVSLCG